MFGRNKKIPEAIGIHIGRTSLTVARIIKPSRGIELRQIFHKEFNRTNSVWPADQARSVLAEARKHVNLKAERVHLTLPSDLAPVHFLTVPSLSGEQLENAVKLQLATKWGNEGNQLSYQFQVLDKRGGENRLFTASIPRDRLRQILASLEEVNCPVDVVEVESVSLVNLVRKKVSTNSPIAVLHVSAKWAEIHILRGDRLVLSRVIPRLENDGAKGLPVVGEDSKPADTGTFSNVYYERIADETNKTLDYFEIELLSPAVEHLFLTGEAASASGLTEEIERRTSIKVEVLDTAEMIRDMTGSYESALHGIALSAAAGGDQ